MARRRLGCFLALLFTLAVTTLACNAAASSPAYANMPEPQPRYVYDEAGVLGEDQESELNWTAKNMESVYGVKVNLAYVDKMNGLSDPKAGERTSFAEDFYLSNIGGSDYPGILMVVAVDSRDYVTITCALDKNGVDSDSVVAALENAVMPSLEAYDYAKAADTYYRQAELELAVETGRADQDILKPPEKKEESFSVPMIVGFFISGCFLIIIIVVLVKAMSKKMADPRPDPNHWSQQILNPQQSPQQMPYQGQQPPYQGQPGPYGQQPQYPPQAPPYNAQYGQPQQSYPYSSQDQGPISK